MEEEEEKEEYKGKVKEKEYKLSHVIHVWYKLSVDSPLAETIPFSSLFPFLWLLSTVFSPTESQR